MILTEEHIIRCHKQKELYRQIDAFCYRSKNLYNAANYLISQCSRISRKCREGAALEEWEEELASRVNDALRQYNASGHHKKLSPVGADNGFIADAYFLSWYLKTDENYRAMPYATCAQICLQELCRDWKSFYRSMEAWKKEPASMPGRPRKPGYKDREKGRNAIVLTYQNIKVDEAGHVILPRVFGKIKVRARHGNIRQVRILTSGGKIRVQLMYERKEPEKGKEKETKDGGKQVPGVMAIDLGVGNLMTLCMSSEAEPVIIDGHAVKSINQYYNKRRASLQAAAMKGNGRLQTKRMERLTEKRNRKIKDCMHKASRKVIDIALQERIGTIVIGSNSGWKQNVKLGNITNQHFVSIPYKMLTDQIQYKAHLAGIEVKTVREDYTSGTSFIDGEMPVKENYDRSRRIHRGLFRSNTGILINADVNAAYQIMKCGGYEDYSWPGPEKVTKLKVS